MKKSISNVIAGGLITSATVMGLDAISNPAAADIVELQQTQDFSFNFGSSAMTCCFGISDSQDFAFDGFNASLGVLNTISLGIVLQGLTNDPNSQANTCCFDLTDVLGFDGQIAGLDLNDAIVRGLGRVGSTISLDAAQFAKDLNTANLDFNILFNDNAVFANGETKGSVTLSYLYEPAAVPIPGSAALMAPALAALFASGAFRRRQRDEDE
jgi:hypothetical protein